MTENMDFGDRRQRRRDRDRHSGLAGGLVLITVGAIFLLDQMRWSYGWHINHLWPLILIAIGVSRFFSGRGRAWSGLWLVLVGSMFLLHETRVLRLDQTWPLFIVAGGLALMFGGFRHRRCDADWHPYFWWRGNRRDESGGPHVS